MFFPLNQYQKKGYINQRLSLIMGGMQLSINTLMILVMSRFNFLFLRECKYKSGC
jgi:hypothetical protein